MIEKLKPLAPIAVGLVMAGVVYVMPEAKPWACGLTLGVAGALVP